MPFILDGRIVAKNINAGTEKRIEALKEKGVPICLCIVFFQGNDSIVSYIQGIKRSFHADITILEKEFEPNIKEELFLEELEALNADASIHGIIVMQPIPKHIDLDKIEALMDYKKDVDSITFINQGRTFSGKTNTFYPCTAEAVMELINYYGIDVEGKNVTVVGRSVVIGKPVSMMLLKKNATVTTCHSKTRNLKSHTKNADIIIVAMGKPEFITADYIKEGAIVIDVGVNYKDGKMVGDVDFEGVSQKASMITPVPGGVGSVTSSLLMKHVVIAAEYGQHLMLL